MFTGGIYEWCKERKLVLEWVLPFYSVERVTKNKFFFRQVRRGVIFSLSVFTSLPSYNSLHKYIT